MEQGLDSRICKREEFARWDCRKKCPSSAHCHLPLLAAVTGTPTRRCCGSWASLRSGQAVLLTWAAHLSLGPCGPCLSLRSSSLSTEHPPYFVPSWLFPLSLSPESTKSEQNLPNNEPTKPERNQILRFYSGSLVLLCGFGPVPRLPQPLVSSSPIQSFNQSCLIGAVRDLNDKMQGRLGF